MVWIVILVIVSALAIGLVVQRRHDDDLVERLVPLRSQEVVLCIAPTSAKFGTMGEYVGVISEVDPATRWVTFDWIEHADPQHPGSLDPASLAENGIIADCIRWVEPPNGRRIGLL